MDSTARFLLGGALGAALGFLISQKNLGKALKGAQLPGTQAETAAAPVEPTATPTTPDVPVAAPAVPPAAPPVATGADSALEAELVRPVASAAVVEAPPVSAPPWRTVPRPAPERVPEPVAAPPGYAAEPESPAEVIPEPVVLAPEWKPEPPLAAGTFESDVILTREFLEEPVPGSGWKSAAAPAMAEQAIEDLLPVKPDAILPYAGPEIESRPVDTAQMRPTPTWSEETVEGPAFELPVVEERLEEILVAEEPAVAEPVVAEPVAEGPAVAEPVVAEPVADVAIVELPVVEAALVDTAAEAHVFETPVAELGVGEDVSPGAAGAEQLLAEITGPGTTEIEAVVEVAQFAPPPVEEPAEEEMMAGRPISEPLLTTEEPVVQTADSGPTVIEALVETASIELPAAGGRTAGPPVEASAPGESEAVLEPAAVELSVAELPVVEEVVMEMPVLEEVVEELAVVEEAVAETARSATETLAEEPAAVAPGVESPVAEPPEVEEAVVEEAVVELPVVEEPTAELLVVEEPVYEPPTAGAEPIVEVTPVVEAGAGPTSKPQRETARVDDLRARIEETRRRIRQELEQPFVAAEEPPVAESDWTVSVAVPEAGGSVIEALAPEEAGVLAMDDTPEVDVQVPAAESEPVDYESMKSRIEVTRSRLKAKAFDAMMTGESSLLGRDTGGVDRKRNVPDDVDSEVAETIESSLREEED